MAFLPVTSFVLGPAPFLAKAAVACLLGLAALWPARAWLACLVLVPLGMPIGGAVGADRSLAEPLILAFLAGWLLQETVHRLKDGGDEGGADGRIGAPTLLLATAVAASLVVRLIVLHVWVDFPLSYLGQLFHFLWRDFFARRTAFSLPFTEAAPWLEGLALFVAGFILTRRARGLGVTAVAFVAYGGAVAALVSVGTFVLFTLKAGGTASLATQLLSFRTTVVTGDVNAAGSYFVIALGAAAGCLAGSRWMPRAWWIVVTALALAGLWLTGSRAALLAAPVAALLLGTSLALRGGVLKTRVLVSAVAALAIVAAAYLVSTQHVRTSFGPALQWRTENGATALRMFAAAPVFGVGVGRFYDRSYDFASPSWRAMVPRENAHNNFLQVLAELGLLGLTLLMALLWRVFATAVRAAAAEPDPRLIGLTGGLAASVVTWVAGHPLVPFETAICFWLALGVLAGLSSKVDVLAPATGHRIPVGRTMLAGLGVLIALSVVPRSYAELARSDLSTAGIGFSNWKAGDEGRRFRWMSERAQLFAPPHSTRIAVQFRSPNGLATVKMLVHGRVTGRVTARDTWQEAELVLPAAGWRPFVGVELRASVAGCAAPADCRVQVSAARRLE